MIRARARSACLASRNTSWDGKAPGSDLLSSVVDNRRRLHRGETRDSPLPYNGASESRFFYDLLARRTLHLAIFDVLAALLNNDSCQHMSAFCITSRDRYRHRKALRARRKSHFRISTYFGNHFPFFICDSRERIGQ